MSERKAKAMKFRIHFEFPDGTEDSFVVAGETLEEVRKTAGVELFRRVGSVDGGNSWSEEIATDVREVKE
jgi:hypothetical protein